MIDTSKYEGHTEGPWRTGFANVYCDDKDPDFNMVKITRLICKQPFHFDKENGDWVAYDGHTPANIAKIHPDQLLIADAPLLLAEVKRLRGLLKITAQSYLDDVRSEDMLGESSYEWVKKAYETCKEIGDVIGATIDAKYYFIYEEGKEE